MDDWLLDDDDGRHPATPRVRAPRRRAEWRERLGRALDHVAAHLLLGLLAVLYVCFAIADGFTLDADTGSAGDAELAVLLIFAGDVLLRLVAFGPRRYLRSPWNAFDAASVLGALVLTTLVVSAGSSVLIGRLLRFRTLFRVSRLAVLAGRLKRVGVRVDAYFARVAMPLFRAADDAGGAAGAAARLRRGAVLDETGLTIHFLTLNFLHPELETAFRGTVYRRAKRELRFSLGLATAICATSSLLLYWPDPLRSPLVVLLPSLSAALAATFVVRDFAGFVPELLRAVLAYDAVALWTQLVASRSSDGEFAESAALDIVIMLAVSALLLRLPFVTVLTYTVGVLAVYELMFLLCVDDPMPEVGSVTMAATLLLIIVYYCEATQRRDFLVTVAVDQERERCDALLGNLVPKRVVTALRADAASELAVAEAVDGAVVVAADVAGFAELATRMAAQELVAMLDALFRDFDSLCVEHGVAKLRTSGDAYVAVAGLDQRGRGLAPEERLRAAVRLAQDMVMTAARHLDDRGSPLHLRLGVSRGAGVAGVVGRHKFCYDLWGAPVDGARALCTEPDRVRLAPELAAELEGEFEVFSSAPDDCWLGRARGATRSSLGAGATGVAAASASPPSVPSSFVDEYFSPFPSSSSLSLGSDNGYVAVPEDGERLSQSDGYVAV